MVASPILNIQPSELLSHVTMPIRKILAPAIIQTVPAVISKISLLTPYFMFPFFCIKRFTAPFC